MKIKKQLEGQTLIILLIAITIIAVLSMGRSGLFSAMGTKEKPGTIRVDLNKIQQQTDDYNNRVKQEMNGGAASSSLASSTEDYNQQLQDSLNN
jgi:Tfp pilus assembly protein PilE